jgi:hypothetical protein
VAAETLRDWLYAYRRAGFDGLKPRERADHGHARALPQAVADALCALKEAHPAYSVALVIATARAQQRVPVDVPLAPATVHRLFSRHGLMARPSDGPTQLRHLESELSALQGHARLSETEIARLETVSRLKVAEWRDVLLRRTRQARQILSKLLRDRLVFVPERRGKAHGYRFSGDGTILKLLSGVVPELDGKLWRPQFARVGTSSICGSVPWTACGRRHEPRNCRQTLRAGCRPPRFVAERAERLRGVSGNTFELCLERLFRVPDVKSLLHPEPQRRSITGPLPEPNGHLWRDWRPTRQDSVQELS